MPPEIERVDRSIDRDLARQMIPPMGIRSATVEQDDRRLSVVIRNSPPLEAMEFDSLFDLETNRSWQRRHQWSRDRVGRLVDFQALRAVQLATEMLPEWRRSESEGLEFKRLGFSEE